MWRAPSVDSNSNLPSFCRRRRVVIPRSSHIQKARRCKCSPPSGLEFSPLSSENVGESKVTRNSKKKKKERMETEVEREREIPLTFSIADALLASSTLAGDSVSNTSPQRTKAYNTREYVTSAVTSLDETFAVD